MANAANTKIIEIVAEIETARVSEWKDRIYINLPVDGGRGDRTLRVWAKGDVVTVEAGPGSRSAKTSAALEALTDALLSAGAVRKGYSDSASATYTLA